MTWEEQRTQSRNGKENNAWIATPRLMKRYKGNAANKKVSTTH
jgi:hypothetical protein